MSDIGTGLMWGAWMAIIAVAAMAALVGGVIVYLVMNYL